MPQYDEIEIEDMTYDPETLTYSYPCPCGDRFKVSLEDLWDGEDIADCNSCTLYIQVIYEQDDLPPLPDNDDSDNDENGGKEKESATSTSEDETKEDSSATPTPPSDSNCLKKANKDGTLGMGKLSLSSSLGQKVSKSTVAV